LDVAVAYTSNAFQTAIENEDEEGILEVIADFRGNHSLKAAVWETLNNEQVQYMNERGKLLAKEAREKSSQKEEANRAFAKEWAAKEKAKELIA
jgi:predicted TIM-barrel fold metal-dependent hydrolase